MRSKLIWIYNVSCGFSSILFTKESEEKNQTVHTVWRPLTQQPQQLLASWSVRFLMRVCMGLCVFGAFNCANLIAAWLTFDTFLDWMCAFLTCVFFFDFVGKTVLVQSNMSQREKERERTHERKRKEQKKQHLFYCKNITISTCINIKSIAINTPWHAFLIKYHVWNFKLWYKNWRALYSSVNHKWNNSSDFSWFHEIKSS